MRGISHSKLQSPLAALDDSRLVGLARAGDQLAFEQLVQRHHRRLLARARSVAPPDCAEDAVQNGLLSAWLALQRGTEVRDVRPWLERVVHNAALRALPSIVCTELPDAARAADAAEPAAALDRRQQLSDTLAALSALPELQRQALLQTALEGESYESTARSLGITASTVRGLISRARVRMRAAMGVFFPLPALRGLFGGRSSGARHSVSAAHAGASAAPTTLAAKGAVVLVVAAAGVGTAQVVGGRSAPLASPPHASMASRPKTVGVSAATDVLALRPGGTGGVTVQARHRPTQSSARPRVFHHRAADSSAQTVAAAPSGPAAGNVSNAAAATSVAPAPDAASRPAQRATPVQGASNPIQEPTHHEVTNSPGLPGSADTGATSLTDTTSATPETTSTTDSSSSPDTTSTSDTTSSTDTTATTDTTSNTDTTGNVSVPAQPGS